MACMIVHDQVLKCWDTSEICHLNLALALSMLQALIEDFDGPQVFSHALSAKRYLQDDLLIRFSFACEPSVSHFRLHHFELCMQLWESRQDRPKRSNEQSAFQLLERHSKRTLMWWCIRCEHWRLPLRLIMTCNDFRWQLLTPDPLGKTIRFSGRHMFLCTGNSIRRESDYNRENISGSKFNH